MRPIVRLLLIPLALPLLALDCDDGGLAPLRTGSISGRVSAEGSGLVNVSVTIGAGATRTTDGSGNYRFETLPEGVYRVSIAGFPNAVAFSETARTVTLGDPTLSATVDFEGTFLRTASIVGFVSLGVGPLEGVTVSATGPEGTSTAVSASDGEYEISGLIAGTYTVSVSPPPDVACEPGVTTVRVETGEVVTVLLACQNP